MSPSPSPLSAPLQSRRGDDVSISSYLHLQCTTSLITTIQWTITNCSSQPCVAIPIQLPQSLQTTAAELFIPARTLDYGTYRLQITVSMVAAPQLISVASTYVQIIPSSITPNIMPFGTSMIVHGRSRDLLLDPGTYSVDPDALTFDPSVSTRSLGVSRVKLISCHDRNGSMTTIVGSMADSISPVTMADY